MLKLKQNSILWALQSIQEYSDTYIFPMPFEYEAILYCKDKVVDYIANLDVLNEGIREYRTAITPKSVKGFRVSTQLDPIDSIISLAIIYEISDSIEQSRLPKNKQIVHSFRLAPEQDGTLYDPSFSWSSCQNRCREIANSGDYSYVLVTDISDFYPSIYLHDIETVLDESVKPSGSSSHINVLTNYVRAMNLSQTHKGLPVGPQFSCPISELILDAIDKALLEKNLEFVRYVDDFTIFCKSESDAYFALAMLAEVLYERRGLKLSEQKTNILPLEDYCQKYLTTSEDFEHNSILTSFSTLLDELGIARNPYEEIKPEDISDKNWQRLRSINLKLVIESELQKAEPDNFIISFVLANLARLDDTEIADLILQEQSIYKLFPKLPKIISYLERVRSFSKEQKEYIGKQVLKFVDSTFVSVLEFNRMWFMHLFTQNDEWNNSDKFREIYSNFNDDLTRREALLARGRSKDIEFFRNYKRYDLNINSWVRRAFLAAISCLPEAERKPWYRARSLCSRDFLDKIVEEWAQKNRF